VEQSVRLAGRPASHWLYRAAAALVLIESGQSGQARKLAMAEDFQSAPWDWHWSWTMLIWADVCSRLGLQDRADELYERLAPFAGQLAATGASVWGSIAWGLGTLATTSARYAAAEGHFSAAAKIEERFGAPLLLARTHAGCARALIGRGRPEDLDRAAPMLDQAEATATRLGGGLVAREVAECRTALAASIN
jgi:hypothetical protein